MRQTIPYRYLLVLPMFLLLSAGCGSSSFPSTAIYAAADNAYLALASWQQDTSTSSLHGTWETWTATFRQDMTDVSGPELESLTLSGEFSDQTATLSVNGSTLTASPSGDHLNVVGSIAFARFRPAVLASLPSTQVKNELTTAFSRAIVARKHLYTLQVISDQKPIPQDSDPATYSAFVEEAQNYVQGLQQQHDQIMSEDNPCRTGAIAWWNLRYDPDESLLKLSNAEVAQDTSGQNAQIIANASSLGQSLQQMQKAWQDVESAHVPHIPGLSYDWQLAQSEEAPVVKLAKAHMRTLQSSLTTDEQTMATLKQQARQLEADVKNKAGENGCKTQ